MFTILQGKCLYYKTIYSFIYRGWGSEEERLVHMDWRKVFWQRMYGCYVIKKNIWMRNTKTESISTKIWYELSWLCRQYEIISTLLPISSHSSYSFLFLFCILKISKYCLKTLANCVSKRSNFRVRIYLSCDSITPLGSQFKSHSNKFALILYPIQFI